jgi:hypothetical protein
MKINTEQIQVRSAETEHLEGQKKNKTVIKIFIAYSVGTFGKNVVGSGNAKTPL